MLDWICTPKESRPEADHVAVGAALTEKFINTPLEKMNAPAALPLREILKSAADIIDGSLTAVLD